MAMEGTLKSRNGKLYVLYTSDEYSEPFRQFLWWRVLETRGTGYGERPEAGDIATSSGGGEWRTRNPSTHRSTGSVSTGTGSTQAETVERISINPPAAGGKELRWRDGRWEKLMAKGWLPAGEGKAKTSKKSSSTNHSTAKHPRREAASVSTRHHAIKKSPVQLQREINEALAKPHAQSLRGKARGAHATKQNLVGALKGKPYFARVTFEDRSKRFGPAMREAGPRWTAFVQGVLGHDVSGEGATKEAAVRAAVADLPAPIRRHFEGS